MIISSSNTVKCWVTKNNYSAHQIPGLFETRPHMKFTENISANFGEILGTYGIIIIVLTARRYLFRLFNNFVLVCLWTPKNYI